MSDNHEGHCKQTVTKLIVEPIFNVQNTGWIYYVFINYSQYNMTFECILANWVTFQLAKLTSIYL